MKQKVRSPGRPRGFARQQPAAFKDRFERFYFKNRKRLNEERRVKYEDRRKRGVCVRCGKRSGGKLFCKAHRTVKP